MSTDGERKMLIGDVLAITKEINESNQSIWPQFVISESPDGWFHVQCRARASDVPPGSPIVRISDVVLERLAKGRLAYIRVKPELEISRDFSTGKETVQSYVRFSFRDEPGQWEYPKPETPNISFVAAK